MPVALHLLYSQQEWIPDPQVPRSILCHFEMWEQKSNTFFQSLKDRGEKPSWNLCFGMEMKWGQFKRQSVHLPPLPETSQQPTGDFPISQNGWALSTCSIHQSAAGRGSNFPRVGWLCTEEVISGLQPQWKNKQKWCLWVVIVVNWEIGKDSKCNVKL